MNPNPCTEALRELTGSLIEVLQHESSVLATKAWSKGLIGEELYHDTTISPREKVARVISSVSARAKVDQTAFDKFIDILKSDSSLAYLADELIKKSSELKSETERESRIPELKDLMKELKRIASNWQNFGVMLGIDSRQLDAVAADHQGVENRLREMLKIC